MSEAITYVATPEQLAEIFGNPDKPFKSKLVTERTITEVLAEISTPSKPRWVKRI